MPLICFFLVSVSGAYKQATITAAFRVVLSHCLHTHVSEKAIKTHSHTQAAPHTSRVHTHHKAC